MALHGELGVRPDCAIFADTGAEPQRVYAHLRVLENIAKAHRLPLLRVSRGNLRLDILEAVRNRTGRVANPPFFVRGSSSPAASMGILKRKCTREYKIDVIQQAIRREILGLRPRKHVPKGVHIEQWIGISLDEALRIKPSRTPYITNHWPLIELNMTRQDCLKWLRQQGYPKPPKSSCLFCPYHSNEAWRDIYRHDPAGWEQIVEIDHAIRTGLPGLRGQAYLHRSLQPIDELPWDEMCLPEDQIDLFDDECEGMCSV
jgi:hypothetical protein